MKKRTNQVIGTLGIVGVLGAVVVFFQAQKALDENTTTQEELSDTVRVAFEIHDRVDVQPIKKDLAAFQRRFDRDDLDVYIEALCDFNEILTQLEKDNFDDILMRLGYFPFKGCSWARGE